MRGLKPRRSMATALVAGCKMLLWGHCSAGSSTDLVLWSVISDFAIARKDKRSGLVVL